MTVSTGIITTIAGSGGTVGSFSGDDSSATAATFYQPAGVTLDSAGNIYIADISNHRIRKVTVSTGIITTYAGSGGTGSFSGDGTAANFATLNLPYGLTLDSSGNIYIADTYNYCIRKVVSVTTGAPSTVPSCSPTTMIPTAIPSTKAPTRIPTVIPTAAPTVIPTKVPTAIPTTTPTVIPSRTPTVIPTAIPTRTPTVIPTAMPSTAIPTRIPTVTPSFVPTSIPSLSPSTVSIISTVAGTGVDGYSNDGTSATLATLYGPYGVSLDSSGNIYIADTSNQRIRKVTVSTGIITTIAGTGTSSYSGDGTSATSAAMRNPRGVALDSSGIN